MPDSSTTTAPARRAAPPAVLPRADEILDQCTSAFALKGFDGASMQDLARAAGMSASNFYRYFASKDAIIVALVDRKMAEIERRFSDLHQAELLRPLLLETLADYLSREKNEADGALWAEIQSAASRRPAVAEAMMRMEATVTTYILQLFTRMSGRPQAEVEDLFRPHAAMIFLLSRGAMMTRCGVTSPLDPENPQRLISLVMRAVDQILDDISSPRVTP
jgi:AcrR family transcriptional regulator